MSRVTAHQLTHMKLGLLRDAILMYKLATDYLPTALDHLFRSGAQGGRYPDGVLADDPDLHTDGWGRLIRFVPGPPWELRSAGPDGIFEDEDDIVFPRDDVRKKARSS